MRKLVDQNDIKQLDQRTNSVATTSDEQQQQVNSVSSNISQGSDNSVKYHSFGQYEEQNSNALMILLNSLSVTDTRLNVNILKDRNVPSLPLQCCLLGHAIAHCSKEWSQQLIQDFFTKKLDQFFYQKAQEDNYENSRHVTFLWLSVALGTCFVLITYNPMSPLQFQAEEWACKMKLLDSLRQAALSFLPHNVEELFFSRRPLQGFRDQLLLLSRSLKQNRIPNSLIKGLILGIYRYIDVKIFNRLLVQNDLCTKQRLVTISQRYSELLKMSVEDYFLHDQGKISRKNAFKYTLAAILYMVNQQHIIVDKQDSQNFQSLLDQAAPDLSPKQMLSFSLNYYDDKKNIRFCQQNAESLQLIQKLQHLAARASQNSSSRSLQSTSNGVASRYNRISSSDSLSSNVPQDQFILNEDQAFRIPETQIMHAVYSFSGQEQIIRTINTEISRGVQGVPTEVREHPVLGQIFAARS